MTTPTHNSHPPKNPANTDRSKYPGASEAASGKTLTGGMPAEGNTASRFLTAGCSGRCFGMPAQFPEKSGEVEPGEGGSGGPFPAAARNSPRSAKANAEPPGCGFRAALLGSAPRPTQGRWTARKPHSAPARPCRHAPDGGSSVWLPLPTTGSVHSQRGRVERRKRRWAGHPRCGGTSPPPPRPQEDNVVLCGLQARAAGRGVSLVLYVATYAHARSFALSRLRKSPFAGMSSFRPRYG